MIGNNLHFAISVAVLALLLFVPVTRMVVALSVRRLERRQGRVLELAELAGQRRRAGIITVIVCIAFSYLFNAQLLGSLYG